MAEALLDAGIGNKSSPANGIPKIRLTSSGVILSNLFPIVKAFSFSSKEVMISSKFEALFLKSCRAIESLRKTLKKFLNGVFF